MSVDPLADMALSQAHKAVARKQLAQLAAQDDRPVLRDMARDVLAGRAGLREAMLDPRHQDALNDAMRPFSEWYRNLTPDERAQQVSRAEEYAAEVREEAVVRRRPTRPPVEEDWVSRPILRKRPPR